MEKCIHRNGFDDIYKYELENIDKQMTEIRLHREKCITITPSKYKYTDIVIGQVDKIILWQKPKRELSRHKPHQKTIQILKEYYIRVDQPDKILPNILRNECQILKQIQADIHIHRKKSVTTLQQKEAKETNKRIGIVAKK